MNLPFAGELSTTLILPSTCFTTPDKGLAKDRSKQFTLPETSTCHTVLYDEDCTFPSISFTFGQEAYFPTGGGERGQAGLPFIHNALDPLNINQESPKK
jgi:hypothetical protein